MEKKLQVMCECKNVEAAGSFVCSMQPNEKGVYSWFLTNEKGETFGGVAPSQKEAIDQAFTPKPTIMRSLEKLEQDVKRMQEILDTPIWPFNFPPI